MAVLYHDADLALVNKPHGLPSQADKGGQPGLIEHIWRAGFSDAALHHRLDQAASGVLAIAMSRRANPGLARAFQERSAHRVYVAVLGGPIGTTTWERAIDGQTARTWVEPLGTASGWTAVRLRLDTGRTHQIRRHAAMAGCAVVGDRRYGAELGRAWPRLALHGWRLELRHPIRGDPVAAIAPIPDDLAGIWRSAGGPPLATAD